jgi:hypothetical protein
MHQTDAFGLAINLFALGWTNRAVAAIIEPKPGRRQNKLRRQCAHWRILSKLPREAGEDWMSDVVRAEDELYQACTRVAMKVLGHAEGKVDTLTGAQALDGLKKLVDVMTTLRHPVYGQVSGGVDGGVGGTPRAVGGMTPGTGSIPGADAIIEATISKLAMRVKGRLAGAGDETPARLDTAEALERWRVENIPGVDAVAPRALQPIEGDRE